MAELNTYWNLTEKQRAELTSEQVEGFLDAELMEQGVLKVPPLVLDPEIESPELAKRTFYRVRFRGQPDIELAFASAEAAATFAALKPLKTAREYLAGAWSHSVEHAFELIEPDVVTCQLASSDDMRSVKGALDRAAKVRIENENKRDEHTKATREQTKVMDVLWSDWHRCRGLDRDHRRVVETFEDYKRIAGGNTTVAARFLLKPFTREQIAAAAEWCEVAIPVPTSAEEFAPPPGAVAESVADDFPPGF